KTLQVIIIALVLLMSAPVFAQDTYKVGKTEYYYNKTYSTTGKPMVKRSEANKAAFLRNLGYSSTPYGYEIDHIKPLSQGGTDDPSNMQLLTKTQHARKTASERTGRSNYTYNTYPVFKSNSTSTYNNTSDNYYTPTTYKANNSRRPIHTG